MKAIALLAIRGYKRYISPYKGFSCAHRIHNNGESCSTFAFNAIEKHGLFTGLIMTKSRLRECGEVHRAHLPKQKFIPHSQAGFVDGCDCDCGDANCGDASCCDSAVPDCKDCAPDCNMNCNNTSACAWVSTDCCASCDIFNRPTKKKEEDR